MKKVLFSMAFVAGLVAMNAQTVIWSDDFEDEDVSDWTLLDEDGDGYQWEAISFEGNDGNLVGPALRSDSYINTSPFSGEALTPDNWIISPAIDLSSVSGDVTLKWDVWGVDPSYSAENYSVYVATSDEIAAFEASSVSFNELVTDNGPAGPNNVYTKTLDITEFAGETVYVAFRHHDVTDQFAFMVDNVSVEAAALGVNDLNKVTSSVYPNPVGEVLNVNLSSKFDRNKVTVTLTDLAGRTVKSFGAATAYDVADLAAGVYVVKITDGKNTETKKIVKK